MGNIIIGICGGSGSGKTTVVNKISEIIDDFVFIPQDNYYHSAENICNSNITDINFDHPAAFDNELLLNHLKLLKNNQPIDMPLYDFIQHKRVSESALTVPKKLIILDGILIFHDERIRQMLDLKLFIDTPCDIRFIRRLNRDIKERGRTVESVIEQYLATVRPAYQQFVEPAKVYADIIIPEGGLTDSVIDVFVPYLKTIIA